MNKISDLITTDISHEHFFAARINKTLFELVNEKRKKANIKWHQLLEAMFKIFLSEK
jgi:hypothetical protein